MYSPEETCRGDFDIVRRAEMADAAIKYVQGFTATYAAESERKKRSRQEVDGEQEIRESKQVKPPGFLPTTLQQSSENVFDLNLDGVEADMAEGKRSVMKTYLDSIADYDVQNQNEDRCGEDNYFNSSLSQRPTAEKFWRDSVEVALNDGDDGLSTDYCVRNVYLSVLKTLVLVLQCWKTNAPPENKEVKRKLNELNHDVHCAKSLVNVERRYTKIISAVKTLLLALDTTRSGVRKAVVNQIDPASCCLPRDLIKHICRFNGFGAVSNYGYMECRFSIPIKLIFMGNLETKCFRDQESGDDNTVQVIELCTHFGPYFYECLETIYDVCFETLNNEVAKYTNRKATRDAALTNLKKGGDVSSLLRLKSTYVNGPSTSLGIDSNHWNSFFRDIGQLTRHDKIRIVGTSGKTNAESRLCYVAYDPVKRTVTENPPKEEVDALFVSSFIRLRVKNTGDVYMDVFTRNALQLELETDTTDE